MENKNKWEEQLTELLDSVYGSWGKSPVGRKLCKLLFPFFSHIIEQEQKAARTDERAKWLNLEDIAEAKAQTISKAIEVVEGMKSKSSFGAVRNDVIKQIIKALKENI